MPGFVKTNQDIKMLILYAMSKFHEPPTVEEISRVVICDEGVNYFLLIQSLEELMIPQNITQEGNVYILTKRGENNLKECLSQVPLVLQQKCDAGVEIVNREQDKRKYVKSHMERNPSGTYQVQLTLSDESGVLFDLNVMVPKEEEAKRMVQCFQEDSITYFYALRETAFKLTQEPPSKKKKQR